MTPWHGELAGVLCLIALAIYFIAISWRKWPDPLVDFGRELYIPWRIANGEVLYRELGGHFGPLAQYFNGLLFKIFGPGLMVLVTANLIIFAIILLTFYLIARRAWGAVGAVAGTAVFIAVFGFSQLTRISNYTYAAPYSHETTHGMLVVLLLVAVLLRWLEDPLPRWSLVAGLLFGLAALLKAEFVFAGGLLGMTTLVVRWRYAGPPRLSSIAAAIAGAVAPVLLCTIYFARFFPFTVAWKDANHGWLRFAMPGGVHAVSGVQAAFTGLDQVQSHLHDHLLAAATAGGVIGAIALLVWISKRITKRFAFVALAVISAVIVSVISTRAIDWPEIGKTLLGLLLIYTPAQLFLMVIKRVEPENFPRGAARLLLAVLALAMLTRMALNGRIYHYGFYQAAIAGCIIPAIVVCELAEWLRTTARERILLVVVSAALFGPGVYVIAQGSRTLFAAKTVAVGEGADLFYAFDRRVDLTAEVVAAVVKALANDSSARTLLVIPEGVIINYLARIPTTVPDYFYWVTSLAATEQLEANPPDRVLLISRDLREYGIARYGANAGQGRELLEWLSAHYRQVAHAGGDPLDVRQRGAILFQRTK
ncbi:MAG: glycosyltransferase family 39 protein [Chthoniobacterales bacterium]